MSADNWAPCPMCKRPDTLREDYEIGIVDNEFGVSYSGKCYYFDPSIKPGCGFEFHYKTSLPAIKS